MEWLLVSVALVWGANYTIGKYGVAFMSSIQFNSLRFLVASPVLLLITFLMERSLRIERKDWLRLVAVGIVGTTMYQTMFMLSVKYTSATNASLLIAMSPIFTGILAVLHKQERFSMKVQIGSIVAFIGAAFVLLTGHTGRSYLRVCMARKYNWISRSNCVGMVSDISTTSYYKIFRNESHIMVYFNWNCTSRYILFIQRKHINVASRYAKLGITSIFNRLCDHLWASNVVCRH